MLRQDPRCCVWLCARICVYALEQDHQDSRFTRDTNKGDWSPRPAALWARHWNSATKVQKTLFWLNSFYKMKWDFGPVIRFNLLINKVIGSSTGDNFLSRTNGITKCRLDWLKMKLKLIFEIPDQGLGVKNTHSIVASPLLISTHSQEQGCRFLYQAECFNLQCAFYFFVELQDKQKRQQNYSLPTPCAEGIRLQ